MSTPLYFPHVHYVRRLTLAKPRSLEALCADAGVRCRASGPWISRQIEVTATRGPSRITAEPGDWGAVRIELAPGSNALMARRALAALAYALHDGAAKASIIGQGWNTIAPPTGRPRSGRALSGAERQARFRGRHRR